MDPETKSAGFNPSQQLPPPNYRLTDTTSYRGDDDDIAHSSISRAATSPPPLRQLKMDMAKGSMCHALSTYTIIPAPVQSALDFVVDMTQLIIPSLFMPSLSDECPITAAILDGTGARSYIHACKSLACKSLSCATANPPPTLPPRPSSSESDGSTEPGDTFGFDANDNNSSCALCACACACCTSRCCFTSSVAAVRNWQSMSWRTKSVGTLNMMLRMPSLPPQLLATKHNIHTQSPFEESLSHTDCATDAPHAADLPPYTSDICRSVAGDKNAATDAESRQFSAPPPSSTASDIDEPSAPSLADLAAVDARLLDVNQYLLRRIRKLELTNQIFREAYAEVQEMLQAERQSKITQLKSLERKHEEDMEKLVQEYQDRADRSGNDESPSESSSDSESEADYVFHPGFTTSSSSNRARVSTEKKVSVSNNSSPLMSSAKAGGRVSPLSIRRTVSATACLSASAGVESFLQADLGIEFLPGDAHDSATSSDSDSESDSCSDADDSDDDAQSEANWETDDDGIEHTAGGHARDDYEGITFSSIYVHMVDSEHDEQGLDTDTDTDVDADSESDGYSSSSNSDDDHGDGVDFVDDDDADEQPSKRHYAEHGVDDGLFVDPAQAVIGRYYAQTGVMSIAADIDDIPTDGYDGSTAARSDEGGYHHSAEPDDGLRMSSSTDFAMFDAQWQTQGVWDAIRGRATDSSGLLSEEVQKSADERELELISSLPAEQRIAKFVCRASSHLQQGARGGLSLGFMMHNIEALSDQYASNHQSILCAFIECLYRMAEAMSPTATTEAALPPSALAKHVRSEAHSLSLVVLRIIRLLHSFITIPDDQKTVLKQLEQLSEANRDVRLAKHALLLRMLYDNELVDKASLLQWYATAPAPAPGLDGHAAEAAGERGRLLRLKAAPLLIELSSSTGASNAAAAIGEMYQQVIIADSSGTMSASASSTPNLTGQAAARGSTGNLTPVSDENATLHSQSSDCECAGGAPAVRDYQTCRSAGILGIGRKAGSRASLGEAGAVHHHADRLRPAKQVTFAAVVVE
ncbi:hypothetical protein IW146_008642 [Coemansia sp. RSA 922]|nr:hypothetical protein IW146_008642 [Coemansia sp. RSA 922]